MTHLVGLLDLAWSFGVTAHNLDLVRVDRVRIIELEVYIFNYKRPDLIAESVGIQMTLKTLSATHAPSHQDTKASNVL